MHCFCAFQYTTSLHSVEVYQKSNTGEMVLVAGELGYKVGNVYTSLTGAKEINSAGSVQLYALGRLLAACGIEVCWRWVEQASLSKPKFRFFCHRFGI